MKRGLQLDRVVLLGRTFDEYCRYFLLQPAELHAKRILDAAGGVSSFSAEANARGIQSTSFDPIYRWPVEKIRSRVGPDLESVYRNIQGVSTYRWGGFYRNPEHMRELRKVSAEAFLADFTAHPERYVPGEFPSLPFSDELFDLTLVSYLLFVYEEQFAYEFHRESILEIMRVTREEARIYPIVTFEGEPSSYLEQLSTDPRLARFQFEVVETDFEFLVNSNRFLSIRHKEPHERQDR